MVMEKQELLRWRHRSDTRAKTLQGLVCLLPIVA